MSRQLSSILVDAVLVRILLDAREYSILVNALAALLLRSLEEKHMSHRCYHYYPFKAISNVDSSTHCMRFTRYASCVN